VGNFLFSTVDVDYSAARCKVLLLESIRPFENGRLHVLGSSKKLKKKKAKKVKKAKKTSVKKKAKKKK
jgi:hypothetical protein